jgi:hypothetical protein
MSGNSNCAHARVIRAVVSLVIENRFHPPISLLRSKSIDTQALSGCGHAIVRDSAGHALCLRLTVRCVLSMLERGSKVRDKPRYRVDNRGLLLDFEPCCRADLACKPVYPAVSDIVQGRAGSALGLCCLWTQPTVVRSPGTVVGHIPIIPFHRPYPVRVGDYFRLGRDPGGIRRQG